MKKTGKALSLSFTLLALVLEVLPFGAVLQFAKAPDQGGGTTRQAFSYFSLTPFGYANFGPFLTAMLSCLLLVLLGVLVVVKTPRSLRRLRNASLIVSVLALFTSLMPLFFGLSYYSLMGLLLSLALLGVFLTLFMNPVSES